MMDEFLQDLHKQKALLSNGKNYNLYLSKDAPRSMKMIRPVPSTPLQPLNLHLSLSPPRRSQFNRSLKFKKQE